MTDADVAVVGGGPAGAAVATLLARAGATVVLLEQAPAWRWRACGVFSSPATVAALRRLGLDGATLAAVVRPIPAMRLEVGGSPPVRLTYGDDGSLASPAVGFDRALLDRALLALASSSGVEVREGVRVTQVELPALPGGPAALALRSARGPGILTARVVVGADGRRSLVASAAGVARRPPLGHRVGLTFHVPDPVAGPHDARMVVLPDAYVGLAPVPGGRLNVGIVLASGRRERLRRAGGEATARALLGQVEVPFEPCDRVAGTAPLGHRVAAPAGPGWLLVGDAAGFLDPFTGEGLHRAFVSAELAARATLDELARPGQGTAAYAEAMRRRFLAKDALSLVVQAFLEHPALLGFAARRLASRPRVRETMGRVIGDLAPASGAFDPRFLAALLRP